MNATAYATFLQRQNLTHDEYVNLVITYRYFRHIDQENDWQRLEKRYGYDLEAWWDESKGPLARRVGSTA
jgi:hypothetical protein